MKKIPLAFALIIGLLTSASTLQAQVNMSRYITLTVTNGAAIRLDFGAAADGTPVRIVSGSNTQNITVGTSWYDGNSPSTYTVTAGASTMTVYGDIIAFRCDNNGANLTALDPSHNTELRLLSCYSNQLTSLDVSKNTQLMALSCYSNPLTSLDVSKNTQLKKLWCRNNNLTTLDVSKNTELSLLNCRDNKLNSLDVSKNTQLEELYCSGNKFTTATLDDIYCALPVRSASDNAKIVPVESASAPNHATVLATNKTNATAKNWKVQYDNDTDIPATTGSYVCSTPEPNMSRYITLTVKKDSAIKLDLRAAARGTLVRIVSGSNTQDITVGTVWYDGNSPSTYTVTAGASTMTVYGDIIGFNCSGNGANLTALDPLHNTELTKLSCHNNQLSSINVSGCTQLMVLHCHNNTISSLDVSNNTQLTELHCYNNTLSSLDVSNNTQLKTLYCSYNTLSSLNVSHNTQLKTLYCSYNTLSSLDVSKNTQLMELTCYSNQLTSLDVSKNTELDGLNCANNKLNSLDVSKNTQLKKLYCYDNKFTTATLDDIYCALPDRTGKSYGWIQPVYNSSSSNHATVLATNKTNATAKNWKVQYYENDIDIPTTTGSYTCPQLNMSRYITLTVKKDSAIRLDFWAAAAATPVRIVSGSNTQDVTVGTGWYDGHTPSSFTVTAGSTTMTVYGDIIMFDCSKNGANLTALDPSHNTQLTVLNCRNNSLNSLDISQNTQLEALYCHGNKFTTATLDDIFCALPDRTGNTNGKIQPIFNSSSPNHATVLATNAANATVKNWKVQYYNDNTDIPTTTGTYVCGTPHTDIAEASAEPALTLYPNPVADVLYLSATARTVRIYNIYGIEVAHATDTDRVEVSHLPAGIYTVRADGTVAKMVKR